MIQQIPVEQLDDSPFQVRISYGDIDGLARDIERHGLLQPILVRPHNGRYEIVHGHRRVLAIKKLDKPFILAVVRELNDESALLIHGSENIHRKDLTPIEEGTLYRKYMEVMKKDVAATATAFEVSQETVRDKLNLLDLPKDIQDKVHSGKITYDKARQLTILTREPSTTTVVHGDDRASDGRLMGGKPQLAPRTDRHFEAIRILAKDERVTTGKTVAEAAKRIREGEPVEEAIKEAAKAYAVEKSNERAKSKARSPEEMAKLIMENLPDPGELEEKILRQYPLLVKTLLERGLLTCPDCGGSHLVWKCSGREVGK